MLCHHIGGIVRCQKRTPARCLAASFLVRRLQRLPFQQQHYCSLQHSCLKRRRGITPARNGGRCGEPAAEPGAEDRQTSGFQVRPCPGVGVKLMPGQFAQICSRSLLRKPLPIEISQKALAMPVVRFVQRQILRSIAYTGRISGPNNSSAQAQLRAKRFW